MFNLLRIIGFLKTTIILTMMGGLVTTASHFPSVKQIGSLYPVIVVTFVILIILIILLFQFGRWDTVLITLLPILPLITSGDSSGFFHPDSAHLQTYLSAGIILDIGIFITCFNLRVPVIKQLKNKPFGLVLYFPILLVLLVTFVWIKTVSAHDIDLLTQVLINSSIVIIGSLLLIPIILHFVFFNRLEKGQYPLTLKLVLRSSFAYWVFVSGCLTLVCVGFVLFVLPPFKKRKQQGKLFYHRFISQFCRFLVYIMAEKHQLQNEEGEDFTKPAIIIANHQSFIDLLIVIGLHPKLIILTNDWVWNSPFFGRIIQWVDYYPVSAGIENSFSLLHEKVKEGYSIVVFPEGTRSKTMEIKRFKKGAFYLAENLHLDILPVVLHGTGDGIAKGDLILKKPKLTTLILPRISIDNPKYGEGYSQRTKKISLYFKQQYKELRQTYETPHYFKEHLKYTYTYQGFQAEAAVKATYKSQSTLNQLFEQVQNCNRLLHVGCEWGVISHLLRFKFKSIEILGIDRDEKKIKKARTTGFIHDNIEFDTLKRLTDHNTDYDICLINAGIVVPREKSLELLLDSFKNQPGLKSTLIIYNQNTRSGILQRLFPGKTKQVNLQNSHWEQMLNRLMNTADLPFSNKLTHTPNLVIIN